jgi:hypothetical protein
MMLTSYDFAKLFGVEREKVDEYCNDLITQYPLSYEYIQGYKRNVLILSILKRIDEDTQRVATPDRTVVWSNGWQENLNLFKKLDGDMSALIPKFIRFGQAMRFNQEYIQPDQKDFELRFFEIYRQWLFKTYIPNVECVYEFGCGTGFNLVAAAQLFPNVALYGSDFVESACKLVNAIANKYSLNLEGYLFDMINPNESLPLYSNSVVFTIGAIEQLGGRFHKFIDYLIRNKPMTVVHVEPVIELYDLNVLEDYLAYKFQTKRGYTTGLLPHLQELDKQGVIKLEKVKRLSFGSLFMEGYNLIVWRPL